MAFTTKTLGFIGRIFPKQDTFSSRFSPLFYVVASKYQKMEGDVGNIIKNSNSSHSPQTSPLNLILISDDDPPYVPDEDLISISTRPHHFTPNYTTHQTTHPPKYLTPTHISQLTHHQKYHQQQARFKQTFINSSPPSPSP